MMRKDTFAQPALSGQMHLDRYFASAIYPAFPFRNRHWLAVAFDSASHGARMPRWYFDLLVQTYTHIRAPMIMYVRHPDLGPSNWRRLDIPMEWPAFEEAMGQTGSASCEIRMIDGLGRWACWSTGELTVWGGDADDMTLIYERMGGRERVRQSMFNSLHAYAAHLPALAKYVRGLVDAAGRE